MLRKSIILASASFACLTYSCSENGMELDKGSEPLALSASSETIVVNQRQNDSEALTLKWTSGTNEGTGSAIYYTFEMDLAGNNFQGGIKEDIGKTDSRMVSFTNKQLNDVLLATWPSLPLEQPVELEARVIADFADESVQRQISNVVKLVVTPYKERVLDLYMIGGEAPNGWDNQRATPMTPIEGEVGGFYWEGHLSWAEKPSDRGLKFITELGSFMPSYNQDGENPNKLVLRDSDDDPDVKFSIPNPGTYRIKLNLESMDISIECIKAEEIPTYIYMVGASAPNGWDAGNATALTRSASDSNAYYWEGQLTAAEEGLKFIKGLGEWLPCYCRDANDASKMVYRVNEEDYPDLKFEIATSGKYRIDLNIKTLDIKIQLLEAGETVKRIWMIGDATPGGWSWDSVTEMYPMDGDANKYVYEGRLNQGEIKFPTEINHDWSGKFIVAMRPDADINTDTSFQEVSGVDNKWKITEAGNYRVIIDISTKTISFTKL